MKSAFPRQFLTGIALTGAVFCLVAASTQHAHWSYEGDTGPEFWGELDPSYSLCSTGTEQSPIDLRANSKRTNQPLEIHWGTTGLNLVNNGHTIQQTVDPGSHVVHLGKRYELLQFHFHRMSEHTVRDKRSALEMHLVHQAADGEYLVVGVLFDRAFRTNSFLAGFWDSLPAGEGESVADPATKISPASVLPENPNVYNYAGSFTTPPGTEGVKWFVFEAHVPISGGQIREFSKLYPNNYRPVQPTNGRNVTLLRSTRE